MGPRRPTAFGFTSWHRSNLEQELLKSRHASAGKRVVIGLGVGGSGEGRGRKDPAC